MTTGIPNLCPEVIQIQGNLVRDVCPVICLSAYSTTGVEFPSYLLGHFQKGHCCYSRK